MSHGLTKTDMMAYAGETPWHRLGTYVGDENVDSLTMLKAANLTWNVNDIPLVIQGTERESGWFATVREDTGEALGINKGRRENFQNTDVFNFLDELGMGRYHTAGSLFGGRVVWAMIQLDGEMKVRENDKIDPFIVMQSGHDGVTPIMLFPTAVRVVCNNTLTWARGAAAGGDLTYRIRHTSGMYDRLEVAKEAYQSAYNTLEDTVKLYRELDSREMTQGQFCDFAGQVYFETDTVDKAEKAYQELSKKGQSRANNVIAELQELFNEGLGNNGETRYDALNAVTQWIDHKHEGIKKNNEQLSRALDSAWNGKGARQKARAVKLLSR